MYSVLNTLLKYTYFYISKNITSYTFVAFSKIIESLWTVESVSLSKKVILVADFFCVKDITEKYAKK